MISILFVDDDRNVTKRVEESLRTLRSDWHVFVAHGAVEALELMKSRNIDAVITDMTMPHYSGGQLVTAIRESFPETARILMSGFSETKEVVKTVGEAHQYLTKPLKVEELIKAVESATAIKRLLAKERLRTAVAELRSVPSLPTIYQELVEEINRTDGSIRRIAEIVRQDIAMTAKILQIANSAFFGFQRQVTDPGEAVRFLGLDTVTSLVLAIGVFTQFENGKVNASYVKQLWNHSTRVAQVARDIARIERPTIAEDAFTAGLLHEIGEVVMAVNSPSEYSKTKHFAPEDIIQRLETERELFGATHAEIGAYLLSLWGLPDTVVESVAFHHTPFKCPAFRFEVLTAVHVADGLVYVPEFGSDCNLDEVCDREYLRKAGVEHRLQEWFDLCVASDAVHV